MRCRRKISSIAEGQYCSAYAPIRCILGVLTKPTSRSSSITVRIAARRPAECLIANKVVDARKEDALTPARLLCPNCGSTSGFGPYDSKAQNYIVIGKVGIVLTGLYLLANFLATSGELQCFKCLFVFRPPQSKSREIGCMMLAVGGVLTFVGIVVWKVLQ